MPELSKEESLNQFYNYLVGFKKTWAYEQLCHQPHKILGLFTGNQFGKTSYIAHQYVERILGEHPIPKRNVLYFECEKRTFRFCSKCGWEGRENETEDLKCPQCERTGTLHKKLAPHGYHMLKHQHNKQVERWYERGTWNKNQLPKDMKCPDCGMDIIIHERNSRIFRFSSENLPTDKEDTGSGQSKEISNAVYPEFKKWLPDFLIKRDSQGKKIDITIRRPSMTITDINAGRTFNGLFYPGSDIVVEFSSYRQTVQSQAGVQRLSIWADESMPYDYFIEQMPRLIAEDGDLLISLTPAMGISWEYDEVFENACKIVRTEAICNFLNDKNRRKKHKRIEFQDTGHNICVIQAATDDNPTLTPEAIEETHGEVPQDDLDTRRYGLFKQASGRIFKAFDRKIHVIDPEKYGFSDESRNLWCLGRAIDYHEGNPWAILWAGISANNEAYVYLDWEANIDDLVTDVICEEIASRSGFDKFELDLIDPLANKTNVNTGKTTVQEMNKKFWKLKHSGECSGANWMPWNTKGTVGRDEIKKRMENSVVCGKPNNNKIVTKHGNEKILPTIWFFSNCRNTINSIHHWRYEVWASNRQLTTKDKKGTPQQKFSHFCTALEALFKDKRFRPKTYRPLRNTNYKEQYFQGRR